MKRKNYSGPHGARTDRGGEAWWYLDGEAVEIYVKQKSATIYKDTTVLLKARIPISRIFKAVAARTVATRKWGRHA